MQLLLTTAHANPVVGTAAVQLHSLTVLDRVNPSWVQPRYSCTH
jgi:hypothetical protein